MKTENGPLPIHFNLRHLEENNVHLKGEVSPADLELDALDEMIHATQPLCYELEIQRLDQSVLAQGCLCLTLDCECVRCLKPFQHTLKIDQWAWHLPLEGDDKVAVVNDLVDLTPYIREDIVLALPQHPLCDPGCGGLGAVQMAPAQSAGASGEAKVSLWAELDKLKL